jgi:hypothetical protein
MGRLLENKHSDAGTREFEWCGLFDVVRCEQIICAGNLLHKTGYVPAYVSHVIIDLRILIESLSNLPDSCKAEHH